MSKEQHQSQFLSYLRISLDTLVDYFSSNAWLHEQSNVKTLASFINSAAWFYPEEEGQVIFNDPARAHFQPRSIWTAYGRRLVEVASSIQGRKSPGANDGAMCHRALKTLRALRSTVPDNWPGEFPDIPEKVSVILDRGASYYKEGKG